MVSEEHSGSGTLTGIPQVFTSHNSEGNVHKLWSIKLNLLLRDVHEIDVVYEKGR